MLVSQKARDMGHRGGHPGKGYLPEEVYYFTVRLLLIGFLDLVW